MVCPRLGKFKCTVSRHLTVHLDVLATVHRSAANGVELRVAVVPLRKP